MSRLNTGVSPGSSKLVGATVVDLTSAKRHTYVEGHTIYKVCINLARLANADESGRPHVYNYNGLLDLVAVRGMTSRDIVREQWDPYLARMPDPPRPTRAERKAAAEALRAEAADRERFRVAVAAATQPKNLSGAVIHQYIEGRNINEVCANLAKLANADETGRVHIYRFNNMMDLKAVKGQSGADVKKPWDERYGAD